MKLLLLAAALVAWWAWKTRAQRALRIGDVTAVIVALAGLNLLTKGDILPAVLAIGGAGGWAWLRRPAARTVRDGMPLDEARRLLGVPRGADAGEVRAAHRRLLLRVHPDLGGSDSLTAQVNAARDALLSAKP